MKSELIPGNLEAIPGSNKKKSEPGLSDKDPYEYALQSLNDFRHKLMREGKGMSDLKQVMRSINNKRGIKARGSIMNCLRFLFHWEAQQSPRQSFVVQNVFEFFGLQDTEEDATRFNHALNKLTAIGLLERKDIHAGSGWRQYSIHDFVMDAGGLDWFFGDTIRWRNINGKISGIFKQLPGKDPYKTPGLIYKQEHTFTELMRMGR